MVKPMRRKAECREASAKAPWHGTGAWLALGLALLCCVDALAQGPYQQPLQFRPMEPSNARGVPPWQPIQQPAQIPGQPATQPYGQAPAQPPTAQPGYPQTGGFPPPPQPAYGAPFGAYPGAPAANQAAAQPSAQPPAPPGQYQPQPPARQPGFGQPPGQVQPGRFPPGQTQPGPMQPMQPGQFQPGQQAGRGYPGYGNQGYGSQGAYGAGRPRLEVVVADRRPYVQQNVLVRLRVISAGNLATASPQLEGLEDALFEQIDGPNTRTRGSGNNQEIVNEYVLTMTPLRDGPLEIGPIKVSGTLAGGFPFEAEARSPIALDVRPPMASVRPWLPLRTLRIDADLQEPDALARGRPATLTVELEAEGAVGEQLPSLEGMLRSDDFRVYREQTMTDTRLAENGQTLIGKRIEVYTLVPQTGGRLQLPELRLAWWNVETARREASSVPIHVFNVAGESGPFGFTNSNRTREPGDWRKYWLPVAGIALLLLGYWGGVWLRGRVPANQHIALGPRIKGLLATSARMVGSGFTAAGRFLNPAPLLRRLRGVLAGLAPQSARVYQCARAADAADDPAAWCLAFQQQACRRLSADAREPLPRMADRITALRPGADAAQVQQLMQELDRALYNNNDIDFARWKRDFRRALRPGTGALGSLVASRVRRARLPELNPRPSG